MLGKNIKELRTERGLTQSRLAKEIGVSQGAVYFWENGINEPSASYIIALADFFGITTDELLSFECSPDKLKKTTDANELMSRFAKMDGNGRKLILELAKTLTEK